MTVAESCSGGCWYLAQGFCYCRDASDGRCLLSGAASWRAYRGSWPTLPTSVRYVTGVTAVVPDQPGVRECGSGADAGAVRRD
jgi:hypothetical protein